MGKTAIPYKKKNRKKIHKKKQENLHGEQIVYQLTRQMDKIEKRNVKLKKNQYFLRQAFKSLKQILKLFKTISLCFCLEFEKFFFFI